MTTLDTSATAAMDRPVAALPESIVEARAAIASAATDYLAIAGARISTASEHHGGTSCASWTES